MKDAVSGAGGVVFNRDGKVLVLKHKKGEWVFPKGHIDPGETELEAALREVEEEAGVSARCDTPQTRYTTRYVNDKGEAREITWFLLHSDAEEPLLREKTFPGGGFFNQEGLDEKLSFAEDRALFKYMLALWRQGRTRRST